MRRDAATQSASAAPGRELRIWTLAQSHLRPALSEALGVEQKRLTDALADLVRDTQDKGWVRPELDPASVAVFVQAYTLGKAVDDITPNPVDPDAWDRLVNTVIADVFMGNPALRSN